MAAPVIPKLPGWKRLRYEYGGDAGLSIREQLLGHASMADLELPDHYLYKAMRNRAARLGVTVAGRRAATGGGAAAPLAGKVAVMPADDRDGRYGRPGVYVDYTGRAPIGVVGQGRHLEDMVEEVDDMKRRGLDVPKREQRGPTKSDWMNQWDVIQQMSKKLAEGSVTTGHGAFPTNRSRTT